MVKKEVLYLCLEFTFVFMFSHEKPVHKTLWPHSCSRNTYALNDCNWCWCDNQQKFSCSARVCRGVDVFGHFNDAVRDINVGMEGHGVWRTSENACQPGVQYQRQHLVCVCGDDGAWPSPVCRDTFQILHSVELLENTFPTKSDECNPGKLYVVGCNVCICPPSGQTTVELCTKRNCTEDDPVIQRKNYIPENFQEQDLYAECKTNNKYKIGCKNCVCLRNNRLICDDCSNDNRIISRSRPNDECSGTTPGMPFEKDCHNCVCDKRRIIYSDVKACVPRVNGTHFDFGPKYISNRNMTPAERPYDDRDCTPGTKYKKDCNMCHCYKADGVKVFSCTLKQCYKTDDVIKLIETNCVEATVYKKNCLKCRCDIVDEIKRETCTVDYDCVKKSRAIQDKVLNGYCEPLHSYKEGCNECRCLSTGKSIMCTPKICHRKTNSPVTVDIVPVTLTDRHTCPKNQMYKVDCNLCFCLSNGNSLCTTVDCKKDHFN